MIENSEWVIKNVIRHNGMICLPEAYMNTMSSIRQYADEGRTPLVDTNQVAGGFRGLWTT